MVVHEMSGHDFEEMIKLGADQKSRESVHTVLFQIRSELMGLRPKQVPAWFRRNRKDPGMSKVLDTLLTATEQYATLETLKMGELPLL